MDENENNNESEEISVLLKSIWNSFDSDTKESMKNYIMDTLATKPEARGDLIKVAKQEFDFNIEPYLEKKFGEIPGKKKRIEDLDIPMTELADSIFRLYDDGYGVRQTANKLEIWPASVSRILKDRTKWEKRIKKEARQKLPYEIREAIKNKFYQVIFGAIKHQAPKDPDIPKVHP